MNVLKIVFALIIITIAATYAGYIDYMIAPVLSRHIELIIGLMLGWTTGVLIEAREKEHELEWLIKKTELHEDEIYRMRREVEDVYFLTLR